MHLRKPLLGPLLVLLLASSASAEDFSEPPTLPLAEVVKQLAEEGKRTIEVENRLRAVEVELIWEEDEADGFEVPWREKLEWAASDAMGELREVGGVLHVVWMPVVRLSGRVGLKQALQEVAKETERKLVLDPLFRDVELVVDLQFLRWPDALRALAYAGRLEVRTDASTITVAPLAERRAAPEGLVALRRSTPFRVNDEGPRMALTLKNESLYELVERLGGVVPGVSFDVLPTVLEVRRFSLELPEAPWRRTLSALAAATDMTLEERGGRVVFYPGHFVHARGADVQALLPALSQLSLMHLAASPEVRGAWDCDFTGFDHARFVAEAGKANGTTVHRLENQVLLLVGATKPLRQPWQSREPLTWGTLPKRVQAWSRVRDRGFALIDQAPVWLQKKLTISGEPAVLAEIHQDSLVFICDGERKTVKLPAKR